MSTRIFITIYILVAIAAAYLLATIPAPKAPMEAPKPLPDTCRAPEGWTGRIERTESPHGAGWACVLRKGSTVKAFFY